MKTDIRVANCRFGNFELPHCHRVAQVTFRAEMESGLVSAVSVSRVDVHPFCCHSSVCADSLQCQCGNDGIHSCGFDEA